MTGDILGEENIDGNVFLIVKVGVRVFKLAKQGFDVKRTRR